MQGTKKAPEVPPADAFPALGKGKAAKAPVWVAGQDTSQVIARALQVKTPPPPAPVVPLRFAADYLTDDEEEEDDIPTFEEYTASGSGWGDD